MKKLFFIIGLAGLCVFAGAQNNINQYEYWFDSDFANRVVADVTPAPLFTLNTAVSTANLENGLYTLHIRFRDDSLNFSSVVSQFFQKVSPGLSGANVIAGFEYWFDGDYAGKVFQTVTLQALYELNTAISADQLSNGLHTFHTRFIDTEGNWSAVVSQFFQKISPDPPGTNAITGFEYWFDGDYGNKVYQTVTPQTLYELNTAISADTFANGLHTFHTRFLDNEGNWSSVVSQFFQKISPGLPGANAITGFEYWFDGDYSNKVYQTITPQALYELNTAISADTFANGLHTFHTRFVDAEGNWSAVVSRFFQKVSPGLAGANTIAGFEYWFDSDYAGKVFQTVAPQALYELNTAISADTLANGLHTFHTRFVDAEGNWSAVVSQFFQKISPGQPGANAIAGFEYWFDGNYAEKAYQTATSQTLYQLDTAISAAQLDVGLHAFHIRFQDTRGNWSSTTSQFFQKIGQGTGGANVVSSYRYWFDNDVSTVVNQTLNPPSNPLYLITEINLSPIDTGEHQVHFQFRDTRGQWSVVVTDTIIKLGEPRLDNIIPDKGGNSGTVTVSIHGTGFYSGTNVRLTRDGQPDIVAPDSLTFIIDGQRIVATFDLKNQTLGFWNVAVEIPGDTLLEITDGFEIIEGTLAEVTSNIVGFGAIRPNQWQGYTLNYSNNGNIDADYVPLWLSVPTSMEVDLDFALAQPSNNNSFDTINPYVVVDTIAGQAFPAKVYPLILRKIPPKSSGTLSYKVRTASNQTAEMRTWANPPSAKETFECINATAAFLYNLPIVGDGVQCVQGAFTFGYNIGNIITTGEFDAHPFVWNILNTFVNCYSVYNPVFGDAYHAVSGWAEIPAGIINDGIIFHDECKEVLSAHLYRTLYADVITSFDPNEKLGPLGAGASHYLMADFPLNYTIHFENFDTATADAQNILVVDTLDATVFDFSSFQLDFLAIGDTILNISPGKQHYERYHNMIATQNVVVKITANFNDTTGVASWLFESLDPQTLAPVANPFDGFLPPNQTAPEGEGAVHYSVKLISGLPNNTLIKNKAYIYFDNNLPIPTQEWQNTLDNIKPHSQVEQVTSIGPDTLFNVTWNGVDTSSGIRYYSIYVAINGGAYRPWLINADFTSAVYNGETDSVYCFYSIATDWAGNVEAAPLTPDACISSAGIRVSPVAYLQGAYDSTASLMRDNLRANGDLPLSEPFTALGYTHVGGGGESTVQEVFDISDANAIVDWVFVELRDGADPAVVLATRSALLQRDGDVVDVDGVSPVAFSGLPEGEYYLAIKHRNHLGVMSATPVALSAAAAVVDFTSDIDNAYGGINGIATLGDGHFGLYSGDFNRNGQVQNTDYAAMVLTIGIPGYVSGDLDLNGQVQNVDVQFNLVPNIGRGQAF